MSQQVTVTRGGGRQELERRTWEFVYLFDAHTLVLGRFFIERRKTARGKFRTVEEGYHARLSREATPIVDDSVPLPDDVKDEAARRFAETLSVMK